MAIGKYALKGYVHKSHLYEGRIISGKFQPEYPGCKGKWFKVDRLPISMTKDSKDKILDCLTNFDKIFVRETNFLYNRIYFENLHLLLLHPIATIKFWVKRR